MIFVAHDVLKSYKINLKEQNGLQYLLTKKRCTWRLVQGTHTTIPMLSFLKSPIKKVHTSNIEESFQAVLEFHKRTYPVTVCIIHTLLHKQTHSSQNYIFIHQTSLSNSLLSNLVSTQMHVILTTLQTQRSFFPTHEKK